MQVGTSSSIHIARPRELVFRVATVPENLPKMFRGAGPVSAIEEVLMGEAKSIAKGVVRQLRMKDGSTLSEEFVDYQDQERFAYRIVGIKPPLSLLVGTMNGKWTFADEEGGTRVSWSYVAELRSPLLFPFGALLLKVFMNRAMNGCLARLSEMSEGSK